VTSLAPGRGHVGRRVRTGLMLALALALVVGALCFVLRGVGLAELEGALLEQPARHVVATLALTALSFACLAIYDVVGARLVAPGRVPARVALLAGAAGGAIANTVGFHALSGSAVRAHLYLPAGLRGAEVARVASLAWIALAAGNATMLAAAELFQAAVDPRPALHLGIGLALAAALAAGLACLSRGTRELALGRFRLPLPSARVALLQMALGAVESGAAIGALYVLLPPDLAPPFSLFAVGCIAAVALGVVAHTPGGIGVFEAGMIALLSGQGRADLLVALLLYRLLFNLLPFALALLALGWRACVGRR